MAARNRARAKGRNEQRTRKKRPHPHRRRRDSGRAAEARQGQYAHPARGTPRPWGYLLGAAICWRSAGQRLPEVRRAAGAPRGELLPMGTEGDGPPTERRAASDRRPPAFRGGAASGRPMAVADPRARGDLRPVAIRLVSRSWLPAAGRHSDTAASAGCPALALSRDLEGSCVAARHRLRYLADHVALACHTEPRRAPRACP